MNITDFMKPETFAMALVVFLLFKFNNTLEYLSKSVERNTKATLVLVTALGSDIKDIVEKIVDNGKQDSESHK